ncbi:MAG: shikimate dehydrogenase [Bacteroidales bacterium]|nr:shikimate dehydrogenase [Bacteroidales bacterium]
MRQYGLIGKTLGHSFSQAYFQQKFAAENRPDCRYDNFELPTIDFLRTFVLQHPDLQGFNVTIPYKKVILPFLDELDPEAEQIGAVNTVRVLRDGQGPRLVGFNTDAEGFRLSLAGASLPSRALILGTGGATAAVTFVLQRLDVECLLVSRHPDEKQISYAQLTPDIIRQHPLIVNCTPVGMHPHVTDCPPLPYEAITAEHFLYDLIYNPEETLFLREGRLRGARTQNGTRMLHLQAEAAWNIWNQPKRTLYSE